MALIKHVHRDLLGRVIKHGDWIVWTNCNYGMNLIIAQVIGTSPQKVKFKIPEEGGRETRAYPKSMIVITSQIMANIEGNVGVTENR